MRKIFFKFTLFSAIFFVLLQYIVIQGNPYLGRKVKYFKQLKHVKDSKASYLILGDSQPAKISQELLGDQIYNLAEGSDSAHEMYLKLVYALKNNPHIKGILLNSAYNVFGEERMITNNRLYIKAFTDAKTYEELYGEPFESDALTHTLKNRVPALDPNAYVFARRKIMDAVLNLFRKDDAVTKQAANWAEVPEEARRATIAYRTKTTLSNIRNDSFILTFHKIFALCETRNIEVIGIRYPLTEEYLREARHYELSEVDAILHNMPFSGFFDYRDLITDIRHFANADHLNQNGIKILVKTIFEDLNLSAEKK